MSEPRAPIEETQIPGPGEESAVIEPKETARNWLQTGPRSWTLSEGNLFLILAIIIGLFSGMAVVCFRITIEWIRLGLLGSALAPPRMRVLSVPCGVGLVVAFLVRRFFPGARGSGVNQTKAAVYVFDGY